MINSQLISIWQDNKNSGKHVTLHSHNYHELVYYIRGNGTTSFGNVSHAFTDSTYSVFPPNTLHDELHQSDTKLICLAFVTDTLLPEGLFCDTDLKIQGIIKEILDESDKQRYGYKELVEIKLSELCLRIHRNTNNETGGKNFEYIINYLKENYHEKLVLSECSNRLGLSYDHFQHKFKKITGQSPRQFVISQRLIAAKALLKSSELSCTDIAYNCGFSNSAQFSAIFKKNYGITPIKYRNKCLRL